MRLTVFTALALALAAPAFGAPVAQETAGKTAAGATFVIPKDWSAEPSGAIVKLSPPETTMVVSLVDVGKAADASAAAAVAWKQVDPAFSRPVRVATARAPVNGWDERQFIIYETSPNEKLSVIAFAVRRGDQWTVALLRSDDATAEKRGAALNALTQSLRPAGYQRESFAGKTARSLDAAQIETLKSFVREAMAELGVPGVGLALIDNGRIVYEGGIGVRAAGRPEPVDADTRFMIASNTKGMATLLLAKLVDEGRLKWDQPVTQVYPQFRLGDDATTKQTLVRHLVCACTGVPRKDLTWLFNTNPKTPASDTFAQLAATQPTSKFGEVFQYNNLITSAGGYIGGHLAYPDMEIGAAFDRAMDEKIFRPLGMTRTTFDNAEAMNGNWARPHGDGLADRPTEADMNFNYSIAPFRPAGGAWSTAHDMALYVLNELRQGRSAEGKQLFSEENLLARRSRGVSTGEDQWYGMGLFEDSRYGVPVIHHGGSMGGYKSDWLAIPGAQVGAVILTNSDNGYYLLAPFKRRLLEILYDGKPEAAQEIAANAARIKAENAKFRERLTVTPAPDAVAMLAPVYANPELGRITVQRRANGVRFDFESWGSDVASRKNDDGTTSFITTDPTDEGLDFVVGERDGKRVLTTRDSQHEYVFVAVE